MAPELPRAHLMAVAAAYGAAWGSHEHDGYSVLVAEDEPETRRALATALRADGYDVHAVADGRALLIELTRRAALQRPRVDLIVADVHTSACGGLATVEIVRKVYGEVAVVLLTSLADAETRARAAELGAILLDKPVRMDALRGVVSGLLRSYRARGA